MISLEYIAGFFDGEGSASFTYQHSIRPTLTIAQKNAAHLKAIAETLQLSHPRIAQSKTCFFLVVQRFEDVLSVIRQIESLCILKREELGYLRRFTESRIQTNRFVDCRYTQNELQIVREYCERFHRTDTVLYQHLPVLQSKV